MEKVYILSKRNDGSRVWGTFRVEFIVPSKWVIDDRTEDMVFFVV